MRKCFFSEVNKLLEFFILRAMDIESLNIFESASDRHLSYMEVKGNGKRIKNDFAVKTVPSVILIEDRHKMME